MLHQTSRLTSRQQQRPAPPRAGRSGSGNDYSHQIQGWPAHAAARRSSTRPEAPGSLGATRPTPSTTLDSPVLVAGAGIAGLAVAVALSKVGIPVRVFEKGPGLRQEGAAIGLWPNAWRALDALGVGDQLRSEHLLLSKVELCSSSGELLRSFGMDACGMGSDPRATEMRGVRRAVLLQALYDAIPNAREVVAFGTGVEEVVAEGASSSGRGVSVRLSDGTTAAGALLVGSDGVGSAVARHLGQGRPRYCGYVAYRGVADYPASASAASAAPHPAAAPGGLPPDTIRQIWGAGVRAGLYPVTPSSYYWFVCLNMDEQGSSAPPATPEARRDAALAAVRGWSWDVEEAIRRTPAEDVTLNRVADRWAPFSGRHRLTLAGDAAHPMTPNLGQGGCVALEDAVVLARTLAGVDGAAAAAAEPDAVATALRRYEAERVRRAVPLTVRSALMGAALQIPLAPVCFARNTFVRTALDPSHFLDHSAYDCGTLQQQAAVSA